MKPRRISDVFLIVCLFSSSLQSQGKFSGYMFGDYFYNVARDSGIGGISKAATSGPKSHQAFQFRRIYFTYDNDISDQFFSRFRLEADQGSNTTDGKIGVAVKDAFLRWKQVFDGSDAFFGVQPTPAFDVSEAAWAYRSLEKTIMDLRGIVPSRDLGIALKGKVDDSSVINYWLMVSNGAGNKPETDKYKRYSVSVHVKPTEQLQLTAYGDYSDASKRVDPYSTSVPMARVTNGTFTSALFVGYSIPSVFNLGVEGFLQSTMHGFNDVASSSLKDLNVIGVSIFGYIVVATDLAFVARYDHFDPNSDAKGDVRNYIIGSMAWNPHKNVSVMPNVLVETYEELPGGRAIDSSVTGRLTLYYVFL